jgi:uncharacterized protein (TIGR04255 family)
MKEALVLTHSPIFLALVQVRISPILQMEAFIPKIQEELRNHEFPQFKKITQGALVAAPGTPNLMQNPLSFWEFASKNERRNIVIGTESIAFTVTDYATFEDFQRGIAMALSTIHEIVAVPLVTRVGFRFVNVITAAPGKSIGSYVRPELLGLTLRDPGVQRIGYGSQLVCRSGSGFFILRSSCAERGPILAPDIQLFSLKADRPLIMDQEFCVLDLDHYLECNADFNIKEVLKQLGGLHDLLESTFLTAVTQEALEEWK